MRSNGMFGVVLILLTALSAVAQGASRYSYADIMLGVVSPTGLEVYRDAESERVTPGSVGTVLTLSGQFPVWGRFAVAPTFSLLATDGRVRNDPREPRDYKVRFQQRELALDALFTPPGWRKLQLGTGAAFAWWTAAENNEHPYAQGRNFQGRAIHGQSLLARGIVSLALRNPSVSGATADLILAWPLTQLLRVNNSAATGYIGLHCGFSMVLN